MESEQDSTARRILFVVTWPLADDTGYTVNARRTIEGLTALGHEVSVMQIVHTRTAVPVDRSGPDSHIASIRNVPDGAPSPLYELLAYARDRAIREFARTFAPDVVHARGTRAGAVAAQALSHLPIVFDVRGDVVAEFAHVPRSPKHRRIRDMERLAFAAPDGLVFVSKGMESWAAERFPHGAHLPSVVVPCTVDAHRGSDQEHSGFHIAYAGGFQSYQPPQLVFTALERVRRLTDADRVSVWTYDVSAEVLAARDRLCPSAMVETLPAERVVGALSSCDIGVIPRLESDVNAVACPTKLAEYLSAGVAVGISGALPEWRDLVVARDVGFSLSCTDEEITSFGARIRQERGAFRARCTQAAHDEFSSESGARRVSKLYEQVLAVAKS